MTINIQVIEISITVPVRVSPGASRDAILGEHDGAIKISVTAAPEKGKANKAVIKILAKKLDLKKSNISIVKGETSQDKIILIENISREDFSNLWSNFLKKYTAHK